MPSSFYMEKFRRTALPKAVPFASARVSYRLDLPHMTPLTIDRLLCIQRAIVRENVMDEDGNSSLKETTQIVISADQSNPQWRGATSVSPRGAFDIGGETWAIDGREGRGVEAESDAFVVVHLIRPIAQTVAAGRDVSVGRVS